MAFFELSTFPFLSACLLDFISSFPRVNNHNEIKNNKFYFMKLLSVPNLFFPQHSLDGGD